MEVYIFVVFVHRRKRSSQSSEEDVGADQPVTKLAALEGSAAGAAEVAGPCLTGSEATGQESAPGLETEAEPAETVPVAEPVPVPRPEEPTPTSPKQESTVRIKLHAKIRILKANGFCINC